MSSVVFDLGDDDGVSLLPCSARNTQPCSARGTSRPAPQSRTASPPHGVAVPTGVPPNAQLYRTDMAALSCGRVSIWTTDERVLLPSLDDVTAMVDSGALERPTEVLLCVMRTLPSRTSRWKTLRRQIEASVAGPWHHPELVVSFGAKYYRLAVMETTPAVQFWELSSKAAFEHERAHCERLPLSLSAGQTWRAILHFESQLGKPFNTYGYYTYYTPGLRWMAGAGRENEMSWTCAQLTTAILRTADPATYGHLAPRTTTPTQLYACAKTHGLSSFGQ